VTVLSALADAFFGTAVTADAVADCAETIEPSAGYANAEPAEGPAFGGDETASVAEPPVGAVMRIASAVAFAPGPPDGPWAAADPKASRAGISANRAKRRTA
jgi:hypothetical protein